MTTVKDRKGTHLASPNRPDGLRRGKALQPSRSVTNSPKKILFFSDMCKGSHMSEKARIKSFPTANEKSVV